MSAIRAFPLLRACAALMLVAVGRAADFPGADWPQARPAEVGLSRAQLLKARDYALTGGGSGVIIRQGRLVLEWGDTAVLYDLKSSSKSIGVTALGLALKDGKMQLDDPAIRHQPALGNPPESNGATNWLPRITLRHLANQVAGFEKPGGYGKLLFEPGTKWHYSDAGPNWLAECVTLAYGRDLNEVMFERVFDPIGIKTTDLRWRNHRYRAHEINGVKRREFGSGIHANVLAMARLGYLYLREGRWKEQQIIPAEFVRTLSQPAKEIAGLVENEAGHGNASEHYSLLWWNNGDGTIPALPKDAFWSWGLHDSTILVIPSLDIVAARAGQSWPRTSDEHYDVLKPFFEVIALAARGKAGAHGSAVKPSGPPYPKSPVINEVKWAPPPTIVRLAPGSDNWPLTWADDDALYTAYGDGRGFEPFVPAKLSIGFSKITGMPPDIEGMNLSATNGEFRGDGRSGRKASGLLMVDGVLYLLARNLDNARLAWSRDQGATWTWADWKFTTSFGAPTFLNFGRNYAGARDNYVYIYSHDSDSAYTAADRMVMARMHKDRISEQAAYEYFVALDANGGPTWSSDVAERGAVFSHRGNCYRSGITYNAGLRRYLWSQILPHSNHPQGPRFQGGFGIYDAPEPWGPWTTAFYTEDWDVGPGESSSLPTKWMSPDGRTMHLASSGNDHFSVRRATLSVSESAGVASATAALAVSQEPGVLAIQSSGAVGRQVGIPSWKAVLRRDDAGNISALHVPADHPASLSSRTGQWPITVLQSKNDQEVAGTMSRGRENYAAFEVETFRLVEHTPGRVVVQVAGPSKNRHFEHERTYTFTPEGITIEGSVLPLIELTSLTFDPHWDRTQMADSHQGAVPMRTQGRVGWVPMPSSGRDGATPLPAGVDFPLEIELRLRRPEPTFVRVFYDQVFEAYAGKRNLIHNNKDHFEAKVQRMLYEKLTGISAGPVAKGARQTFKVRFVFETQEWH